MPAQTIESLSRMTRGEKLTILTGINLWQTLPLDHLGIPSITFSDGPHGLRKVISGTISAEATTIPSL
jgi:beta-glucosidase